MMEVRVSQLPINVVYFGDSPSVSVTQVPLDVVFIQRQPAVVTQIALNVVWRPVQPGAVTQVVLDTAFPLEPTLPRALLATIPVIERWQWKTTVVKSMSGREQRMALRPEPHQIFEYDLTLLSDVDRATALYMLHRYIGRRYSFPQLPYATKLTAGASVGATELQFDLTKTNVRDMEPVAVFDDMITFCYVFDTGVLTSNGIELALPLEESLDAGLNIAPAPLVRVEDSQSVSMSALFGNMPITFTVVPPRDLLRPGQSEVLSEFDNLPLLPDAYVTGGGVPEQLNWNLETLTNEVQDPVDRKTWYHPQISTRRQFVTQREDMDYWRQFGAAIMGRQKPFLIPSHRQDFRVSSTPALSATSLVTDDNYIHDWMKAPGNRYLRLLTANGVTYRKVVEATLNFDRTSTLKLATPLGGVTGDNVILRASLMHKVRLANDELRFSHFNNYSLVDMAVVTVNE